MEQTIQKQKMKTVFAIRIRATDNDEWSQPSYFKTKAQRDKAGSMNRIICGFRTHSFDEKKTLEEVEELFY